jgi:DNA-binding SARP family transcriptional activator
MSDVWLRLLGHEQITLHNETVKLPQKAYVLLAYLALEGRTSRRNIAEFLWVGFKDALNNLSKLCKTVTTALGKDTIVADNKFLELGAVDSDVLLWQSADARTKWQLYEKELMHSFWLSDWQDGRGIEIQDWLEEKRRSFAAQHIANGIALARAHLERGEWQMAVPYLKKVALDPIVPQDRTMCWWLWIMGTFGQSDQAEAAFQEYKYRLRQENRLPSESTKAAFVLALQGDRVACLEALRSEFYSVAHVPMLGRDDLLLQMETAWKAGKVILISGEAGTGKSRLALEFARQKGNFWRFWGRPSDHFVPYSFHARSFGWIFSEHPNLKVPEWIRTEMSRIIPSLGQPPKPIENEEDRLRFFEAQAETFRLACLQFGFATMLVEDAQFSDEPSAQAGVYLHSKMLPYRKGFPRTIFTFRSGGFAPHIEAAMRDWVKQGIAIWIDLEPLPKQVVTQCLMGISAQLANFSTQIMDYCGGNPLLMLESARYFLEKPDKNKLPPHPNIFEITQARLRRLTPKSLQLLRLAAILDEQFSFHMAYSVLGWQESELHKHLEKLEEAYLIRNYRFTHDLILEATLNGMSSSEQAEFHVLALKSLENAQVPASLLLFHAIHADDKAAQLKLQQRADSEARAYFLLPKSRS